MKKLVIERTLQCTEIIEVSDDRVDDYIKDYRGDRPERNKEFAAAVKGEFGLDNCVVTNTQVFVTEGETVKEESALTKVTNLLVDIEAASVNPDKSALEKIKERSDLSTEIILLVAALEKEIADLKK